ncbi:MAG: hypothetical protein ABJE10_13230, partial [bacterium]
EGNIIVASGHSGTYPPGNYLVANPGMVGFANPSSNDPSLSSASAYARKGTDGKNPGIDMDALRSATEGVKP